MKRKVIFVKKVLVPGGTGVMGAYLVPELLRMGYRVDVLSLDERESDHPHLRYFKADFLDDTVAEEFLKNDYDAMVDFMRYSSKSFVPRHSLYCENVGHYIHLSSYRVYADEEHPIRETSPRLLDVSTDPEFLSTDDYCLCKARNENTLSASSYTNWTVVRPAVIFSTQRFQLVTLEAKILMPRARNGLLTVYPEEARHVHASMCWGGDAAKMIARLVCNDAAKGEIYTVANGENITWEDIAGYYKELIALRTATVPKDDYLTILGRGEIRNSARWQLEYDRLFDRAVDNTKILTATGLSAKDFISVFDGLKFELASLPADMYTEWHDINTAMSAYIDTHGLNR